MKSVNTKTKKLALMIPVLIIPFLTMGFWALGGGKSKKQMTQTKGLNLDLPDPDLKEEKGLDKLSFYDQADKDSMKMQEWMRNDPYFKKDTTTMLERDTTPLELQNIISQTATKYNQRLNTNLYEAKGSKPEDEIVKKLKLLQQELDKPQTQTTTTTTAASPEQDNQFSSELNHLDDMFKLNSGSGEDSDMRSLQGTLDKILDIQHPERLKQRKQTVPLKTYKVESKMDTAVIGFYGFNSQEEKLEDNAVAAVISDNQTLVDGSVVKMRLVDDIYINGIKIPSGNPVAGTVQLNGERLDIEISSIKYSRSVLSVKLEVYDMDGLPGIYIPGAISRDVAKEGLNNSLQLMELTSVDPSLKAQATAAGIGTIKNLLSKKAKLTRVMVKAGYKLLLKNKNQNQ